MPDGALHGLQAESLIPPERRRSGAGQMTELIAGATSLATIILLPKCPACLAVYVAAYTGIGLTISSATSLRWGLLWIAVASLCSIGVAISRRLMTARWRAIATRRATAPN